MPGRPQRTAGALFPQAQAAVRLDLPAERTNELRMDPPLGREMQVLLGAMEEE